MMPSMSDVALLLSQTVELSLIVKATLILCAGLIITQLARRARASVRHLVMATSFAALIALPVLLTVAPAMTIDVPVTPSPNAAIVEFNPAIAPPSTAVTEAPSRQQWPAISIGDALRALWLAGAIAFVLPVVGVLWRLRMIRRNGLPTAWRRDELSQLARQRGVARPVDVIEHEAVPGPMTFGVLRPIIVLPPDAREWSDAELRRALMHELEHIQRGDWTMQILARIVAACYWFHPMVWMAWRRLCLEAERSCDDAVVLSEERTDYAEQLVTLAQRMSATPVQPLLGMANRSDLSTRVTAVLDDRLRRGRAGFALALGTIAAAAVIVATVAPVRAVAREEAVTGAAEQRPRGNYRPGERRARALDQELYEAALAGDLAGVREMVGAGANADAVIQGDGSPLIGAARSGNIEVTKYLLDHGANPNQPVPGDGSPLIAAAQNGRLDQIVLLVERGALVNQIVPGDENALMNAAEGGHLEIVKFLVDNGADVNTRIWTDRFDGGGEWRTALSQARKNRRASVVQYLESLGARE